MSNIEERERHFQKIINRWENEGGAIAKHERPRPVISDDQNVKHNPTSHSSRDRPGVDSGHIEQSSTGPSQTEM